MCFSATASFTAGTALIVLGTVTARRARRWTELPFALIPALFGIQQLTEGALWMTFSNQEAHLNAVLTHLYSLFSHVLWPFYVPLAVFLLERVPWRRRLLFGVAVAGAATALYLLYFLAMEPTVSQIAGHHIDYVSPHFYIGGVLALYVLATCVSSLLSSHRAVRWFGVATSISLGLAAALYAAWFISVWCFFAAAISVIVLLQFVSRPIVGTLQADT
ncbi:MAG: DUF6629 family protein [Sphingomicrobium sp.]